MSSEKKQKSTISIIIEGIIIAIIMIFFVTNANPNLGKRDRFHFQKICFNNQRSLVGAIEMYNMDHDVMIKNYDSNVYDTLVREKYIKNNNIDTECDFFVAGDLTEGGYLYCLYHGAYGGQKDGTDIELTTKPKTQKKQNMIIKLISFALCIVPTIIYYTIKFK
jgi:competence protein ComGC